MAHVGSKLLKIKDYEIESTKHKAPVSVVRELVAGGETLETAAGVSRELFFFVGNETHEAPVGVERELVAGGETLETPVGGSCELVFIAGRETRKPEKEVDCLCTRCR